MDSYIGTKIILAEPMEQHVASRAGLVRDGVATIDEHDHSAPGYKVLYEDGYASWSPKATFERAYRRVTGAELGLLLAGEVPNEKSPKST